MTKKRNLYLHCLSAGFLISIAAMWSASLEAVQTRPVEKASPVFQRVLPNVPNKTFTSMVVDFPPAARAVPHRHGAASVYAYVLEGAVRSNVDDKPVRTYRQGESWFEPGARHVLTENASFREPAKLLVILISNTGMRSRSVVRRRGDI